MGLKFVKSIHDAMRKAVHVIRIIVLLFCLTPSSAQGELSPEEYEVINTLFNNEAFIHEVTYFDKGWAHYFENMENIQNRVGIPTEISDEQLKQKFDEKILNKIHSVILELRPYKLEKRKLNNSIHLYPEFDSGKALKKGVFRISKPIVVDGKVAVVKKVSASESPIFLLEKKGAEWQIIYTFYDWYILY